MAKKGIMIAVLAAVFSALMFVSLRVNSSKSKPDAPPVSQIKVFAISNAPSARISAKWSTNVPPAVQSFVARSAKSRAPVTNTVNLHTAANVEFKNGEQEAAYRRLIKATGGSARLFLRADNSTPIQLKGYPLMKAVAGSGSQIDRARSTALTFLKENASLLLLNDPDTELKMLDTETDRLGMTSIRYEQTYKGLDVWPDQLSVHLDQQGDVTMLDGAYIATPENVSTIPQISRSEAARRAESIVPGGVLADGKQPSLIVYGPLDKPPRLAWKSEVVSGLQNDSIVVVDALNGSTLTAFNQCADANVAGSGTGLLGQARDLNVWQEGTNYYLFDTSKPMFDPATDNGIIAILDATDQTLEQISPGNTLQGLSYITSSDPNSWNNPDGVSAAFNFSQTYDYYLDQFGRNSYNDKGSNMVAVVRISRYQNACWNPLYRKMLFGDVDRYAASLDVIGHELTHGVTYSIGGNGVLVYQDQPGALNEAFSDIFGEMIEAQAMGTNDWIIGSQLSSPLRNIANPSAFQISGLNAPYPSTFGQFIPPNDQRLSVFANNDNGGVHENSTIFSHAFYLLAAGMTGAIGEADAQQIFYRCLTQSMQPQSQFIDARLGCIAAAEQMFGTNSPIAFKTAEAFDDVEIYAAPASVVEPQTTSAAVAASDSFMWVRYAWDWGSLSYKDTLFRYEANLGDPSSGTKLATSVKVAMPSVSGNGQDMFFPGGDDSLCYIQTDGSGFTASNAGEVHSVAWSPDRRFYAFVLDTANGAPTNQIVLYDSTNGTAATITLTTPVQDGDPLNNVLYADALSFSPDGKYLAYDAVSKLQMPDGTVEEAWSVYALSLSTLQESLLVSPNASFAFGNPAFGKTSDRYLAIDAAYTNGNSAILTLDLALGNAGGVGVSQQGLGYPQFNGDDSYVIFADQDTSANSGRSIYAQALSSDKMSASGSPNLIISDTYLATDYRRGTFVAPYTAPVVGLTSPAANSSFSSPANITLAANASTPNGTVSRVEFYSGSKLLGTIASQPYSGVWTNVPCGNYRVYARVYDSTGASSVSSPVDFTVHPSGSITQFMRSGDSPGFEFSLPVPQPGLYRLEYSTNLVDWTTLGTFECATNLNFFDTAATNHAACFYRAVSSP